MGNIWFSADTHFFHDNIRKYTGRPYNSFHEMNEDLIKKWNERVKPEDTVYFLGDFNFKSGTGRGEGEPVKAKDIIKRLNGNIIFVEGNHDSNGNGIKTHIKAILLEAGGINIYCTHNPADSNNAFPLNLCGHVHEKWDAREDTKFRMKTYIINVGVDVNNFYPVSLSEVLEKYNKYLRLRNKK